HDDRPDGSCRRSGNCSLSQKEKLNDQTSVWIRSRRSKERLLRFDLDAWMNGTADVSAGLQSQKQAKVRILQQSVKYYMFADVIMGTEGKLSIIKRSSMAECSGRRRWR
ncbi:MAG: hypothetical protein U0M47_09655, partial [Merdibacter sp.]|nr:hypothetical protein [Merdibacter sp.]